MPTNSSGKGGIFTAGLGFGVAAGVALGALVIAPHLPGPESDAASVTQADQAGEDGGADLLREIGPDLVAGALAERPVMILRTPDADPAVVDELSSLLATAGAIDAGAVTLTDSFFDSPDEKFAPAILLDPQTGEQLVPTEERAATLQALRGDGRIDYADGTILPAQAVVLVSGSDSAASDAQAQLLAEIDADGGATVALGPAAGEKTLLDALRTSDAETSTVDGAGEPWAQVAAVLAVAERIAGGSGDYGTGDKAQARIPALGSGS